MFCLRMQSRFLWKCLRSDLLYQYMVPSWRFTNLQPCDQAYRTCPDPSRYNPAPPQPPQLTLPARLPPLRDRPLRVRESPPILVVCFPKAHLMSYSRLPLNSGRLHETSLPRQIGQRQTFQDNSLWQNRYLYVKSKTSHSHPPISKLAVELLRLHAAKARKSDNVKFPACRFCYARPGRYV